MATRQGVADLGQDLRTSFLNLYQGQNCPWRVPRPSICTKLDIPGRKERLKNKILGRPTVKMVHVPAILIAVHEQGRHAYGDHS
jgi:hypothetical protein